MRNIKDFNLVLWVNERSESPFYSRVILSIETLGEQFRTGFDSAPKHVTSTYATSQDEK